MERPHPESTYKVVSQREAEFEIEVSIPGIAPTMVRVVSASVTAEEWIAEHRLKAAHPVPDTRSYFVIVQGNVTKGPA